MITVLILNDQSDLVIICELTLQIKRMSVLFALKGPFDRKDFCKHFVWRFDAEQQHLVLGNLSASCFVGNTTLERLDLNKSNIQGIDIRTVKLVKCFTIKKKMAVTNLKFELK